MVETFYPDAIRANPVPVGSSYDEALSAILSSGFGTGAIYSANLRRLGWEAIDILGNHDSLQLSWILAHGSENYKPMSVLKEQIIAANPSCVFSHDLSFIEADVLKWISNQGIVLAGQCSCPLPDLNKVSRYDVLFSSFPHHVKKFESLGVKAFYVPLGFDETVVRDQMRTRQTMLDGEEYTEIYAEEPERIHDCVFIGGAGAPSHWAYGMEVLNAVAANVPTFKWWGYGESTLPKSSPLRQKYQGEAWGNDMLWILSQSKICINRHGEVAGPYANNQRLFEVTGMNCMLLTDAKQNLGDFFTPEECVAYSSPLEAVGLVKYYLDHNTERQKIAAAGQRRTLKNHTYAQRMKQVSEILEAHL